MIGLNIKNLMKMKKKIERDLAKLAESILQPSRSKNIGELKEEARQLYEKLVLLAFTEKQLSEDVENLQPVHENSRPVEKEVPEVNQEMFSQTDEFAPDGTEYLEREAITEPATEKIKDIVAQMPEESEKIDRLFEEEKVKEREPERKPEQKAPKPQPQNDFRQIGVDYDNLPNFEPLNNRQKEQRPKSLNDRLKKGINIGINERLAFIKNLFDGNSSDYNRVLSQLNTIDSLEEARKFIEKIVKPDYNHWAGKEDFEERFMNKIENKYRR